jgi:hypothetical protein
MFLYLNIFDNAVRGLKGGNMPLHYQFQYKCEYCHKTFKARLHNYFLCPECYIKCGYNKVKPVNMEVVRI